DAYKLSPTLVEALERARGIYWELGKTPMVQKLLDIELRTITEGQEAVALLSRWIARRDAPAAR
ncbi:MAG: hypothetical protein DYH06_20410, partial [Acidobacteria bacterium ACB2]|nr:hypothetical protein [Acidobacteria bacterium ACB2]